MVEWPHVDLRGMSPLEIWQYNRNYPHSRSMLPICDNCWESILHKIGPTDSNQYAFIQDMEDELDHLMERALLIYSDEYETE